MSKHWNKKNGSPVCKSRRRRVNKPPTILKLVFAKVRERLASE